MYRFCHAVNFTRLLPHRSMRIKKSKTHIRFEFCSATLNCPGYVKTYRLGAEKQLTFERKAISENQVGGAAAAVLRV